MAERVFFEVPLVLQIGLPLVAVAVFLLVTSLRRRKMSAGRTAVLASLRTIALVTVVLLAARPVAEKQEPKQGAKRKIMILLDRSESMALVENGKTRFEKMIEFSVDQLVPAIQGEKWGLSAMLFDKEAVLADSALISKSIPDGGRTDIAGAIVQALETAGPAPLALFVLTDGVANEKAANNSAISALLDSGTPVIAVGFGSDQSIPTLSLTGLTNPNEVPPKERFRITARLSAIGTGQMPAFDLLLLKNGQLIQKKTIPEFSGSRFWSESFDVIEEQKGFKEYTIQIAVPARKDLILVNASASAMVNVTDSKDLRILFVQGALSWDYKFIGMALRGDPTMKLTGLSRTSERSVFRQNIESADELQGGFPTTADEISKYSILVFSNLHPNDLSPDQQELVAEFCSKLGGGVLMIGGTETFNSSWSNSRLEEMLPVTFDSAGGVKGMDQPFRMELSSEALQHPVFKIDAKDSSREAWSKIPPFRQYGRVARAKPGAVVWARHEKDEGPDGKRILMSYQRFGAGLSAVICVPDMYLWRLSEGADPEQFDRFWQQLFRFLGQSGRHRVMVEFPSQDFLPNTDIEVTLQKQAAADKSGGSEPEAFQVKVRNPQQDIIFEQGCELVSDRPFDMRFKAGEEGLYNVTVYSASGMEEASRSVDVKEQNIELRRTARDMENLQQWASLSGGLAIPVEECDDASELMPQIRAKIEEIRANRGFRRPFGVNVWSFLMIGSLLSAEWILRKRWNLA